jgi:hypothetical protein
VGQLPPKSTDVPEMVEAHLCSRLESLSDFSFALERWFKSSLSGKRWVMSVILSALIKCLSYIPVLEGVLRRYCHGMRIVTPAGSEAVKEPRVTVMGTCRIKPNGDWILFTQRNDEFWPQGDVQINHVENTWSGAAWLNMDNPEPSTILLAQIDPGIRYLVNYYRRVGELTKHVGIRMPRTPEGIRIADQVVVHKRSA